MKLTDYAKQIGVTYTTVYRWFKAGKLDAYQMDTGTIIVNLPKEKATEKVALYARVSSYDQKKDLARQVERLETYALAKGYAIDKSIKEVASGLNDNRPKLLKLLTDQTVTIIVVEHKDRLTRFGFNYIVQLMAVQDRKIEVIFPNETKDDLVADFIAIITSMAARIYGRRGNKKRVQKIKDCVEQSGDINGS